MKTYQINSNESSTKITLPCKVAFVTIFDMKGNVVVALTDQDKELRVSNALFTKGNYLLTVNYMHQVKVCKLRCE